MLSTSDVELHRRASRFRITKCHISVAHSISRHFAFGAGLMPDALRETFGSAEGAKTTICTQLPHGTTPREGGGSRVKGKARD